MGVSASDLSHAQREYIGGVIETLHNDEADYINRLEKKADKTATNYRGRREPLETYGNASIAFGNPAGGDLATPGAPVNDHLLIPYIWMNLGLEIEYEAALNNSKGLVTDALKKAVEGSGRQMVKWLDIYASNGDGTTKIAVASASYDGTNSTTKKTFVANGTTDSIGATQVMKNQYVKIFDPTGTTQRVGTVGSGAIKVATPGKTSFVTVTDLPSDYVSGDIVVPEGTQTTGYKGVPFIVSASGSYFGISRSSVDTTQSTIVSAGGSGVSAALLHKTYLMIKQRTGRKGLKGEGALELCTNITQEAGYYNLTTNTNVLRFNHNGDNRPQVDVGGQSEEFTWFGARINSFMHFPGNAIYFLNFAYMKIASLKDGGEMLAPFNDFLPAINGTTSTYRAAKQQWWDVARDNFSPAPHRHGALTSLDMSGLPMQKS